MQVNRIGLNVVRPAVEQRLPDARGEADMDQFDFPDVEVVKVGSPNRDAVLKHFPGMLGATTYKMQQLMVVYAERHNEHMNEDTLQAIGKVLLGKSDKINFREIDYYMSHHALERIKHILAEYVVLWPANERG